MIGEFDFDDLFNSPDQDVPDVAWFIFIVFLIIMTLILMNLLVSFLVFICFVLINSTLFIKGIFNLETAFYHAKYNAL